jgi:hypothetical protein
VCAEVKSVFLSFHLSTHNVGCFCITEKDSSFGLFHLFRIFAYDSFIISIYRCSIIINTSMDRCMHACRLSGQFYTQISIKFVECERAKKKRKKSFNEFQNLIAEILMKKFSHKSQTKKCP